MHILLKKRRTGSRAGDLVGFTAVSADPDLELFVQQLVLET
jgi:hypothetical protein